MNTLLDAFAAVSADGPPPSGIRYRDVSDGIQVGLTPDATRLLIVDVAEPGDDDRSSEGVWLLGAPDLAGRTVIVLECRNPALDGVFTHLCEQVRHDLDDAPDEDRQLLVRRRLTQWRELFTPRRTRRMSRMAQVGLWGELAVLRRRIASSATDALDSWVASDDAPGPDFRWTDTAMEVKTTTSLEGFEITVHGLGQLDASNTAGRLLLTGVRAVEEPGGESLPDLVEQLLDDVAPHELLTRLRGRGYEHDPAEAEGWITLSFRETTTWRITEDTPRLHTGLLPPAWRDAVTGVTYTLDAAALGEPLDDDEVW